MVNKYERKIRSIRGSTEIAIDVYCVIEAFDVRCPARQHAIKKLLCAGLRDKGSAAQDLKETSEAVDRAIELQWVRDHPFP